MAKTDSIAGMSSKIELSAEIARIALDCPSCCGPVRKAIQRYRDTNKNKQKLPPDGGRSSFAAMNDKSKDGLPTIDYTQQYT
jgi:hypothetical protein